jgi:hypothetical protein
MKKTAVRYESTAVTRLYILHRLALCRHTAVGHSSATTRDNPLVMQENDK